MRLTLNNQPLRGIRVSIIGAFVCLQFAAAASAQDNEQPDLAIIVVKKPDKTAEGHKVLMKGRQCQENVDRLKREGEFISTLNFPDGESAHGVIIMWTCIKPDGRVISSDSLQEKLNSEPLEEQK